MEARRGDAAARAGGGKSIGLDGMTTGATEPRKSDLTNRYAI